MTTIFTLTSARSGTLYLANLFRRNVLNCASRHEPFFDWGNPTMLGPAIYDASEGRLDKLRSLLAKKKEYIERLGCEVYLESSHAFLKSAFLVAHEFFPDMKLIHLIRDPLKVAKSEAYRELWRRRVRAPFHYYRAEDGNRYFRWALTGREEIYRAFDRAKLSLFQWYLIQWIEIENRAMRFLKEHQKSSFVLHTPHELNSGAKLRELFDWCGVNIRGPEPLGAVRKNRNLGHPTVITPEDEKAAADVIRNMPAEYLAVFAEPPYAQCSWSERLVREPQPMRKPG